MKSTKTDGLAHGKPTAQAQEVLGYLLAREAGVAVPETELGTCEGKLIAVSKMWGPQSMDVPKVGKVTPDAYSSEGFREALRKASGLLAYHAWVGTSDHKDEHLMVRPGPNPNEYEVASIDFALGAFVWEAGAVSAVTVPGGPPALLDNRHSGVLHAVVQRIEAISAERIEAVVGGLPDAVLPAPEKDRISKGLVARQAGVRPALAAAGWL